MMKNDLEQYKNRFDKLYKDKKYDEAIKLIDRYLNKYDIRKFNNSLLRQKAHLYSLLKNYKEAINVYLNYLFINPDDVCVKVSLAEMYYFNHNYNDVKSLFEFFLENRVLDSNSFALHLSAFNKTDDSLLAYRIVQKNKDQLCEFSDDSAVVIEYALILKNIEKYDEAIVWFKKLSDDKQLYDIIQEEIADCYFLNNDFEIAITYYKEILKTNPDDYEIYGILGEIYKELGDNDKASYYLEKFEKNDIED